MWQLLNLIWQTVQKTYALALKIDSDQTRIQLQLGALERQSVSNAQQLADLGVVVGRMYAVQQEQYALQQADDALIKLILSGPPPPQAYGFTLVITPNSNSHTGESIMAKVAAAGASVAVTLQDDGSNLVSVILTDVDGLPITPAQLNGTFPAALLATSPTFTFADATPGPSAFLYTALASPAVSTAVAGGFDLGSVTAVQPIVAGSGQGVDSTCTISGFASGPVSVDGGTWTIVSDPNAPGGFSTVVT